MESQAHVPINSRDLGEEGIHDRLGIAERAQLELWRGQLQRTQYRVDEARARRGPMGLTAHERKTTGRAYRQTRYRLDRCQPHQSPLRPQPCRWIRNAPTVGGQAAGQRKYFRANQRAFIVLTAMAREEAEPLTQASPVHLPTRTESVAQLMLLVSGIYRTGQTRFFRDRS